MNDIKEYNSFSMFGSNFETPENNLYNRMFNE